MGKMFWVVHIGFWFLVLAGIIAYAELVVGR
jgi:hypothetical protein